MNIDDTNCDIMACHIESNVILFIRISHAV